MRTVGTSYLIELVCMGYLSIEPDDKIQETDGDYRSSHELSFAIQMKHKKERALASAPGELHAIKDLCSLTGAVYNRQHAES